MAFDKLGTYYIDIYLELVKKTTVRIRKCTM